MDKIFRLKRVPIRKDGEQITYAFGRFQLNDTALQDLHLLFLEKELPDGKVFSIESVDPENCARIDGIHYDPERFTLIAFSVTRIGYEMEALLQLETIETAYDSVLNRVVDKVFWYIASVSASGEFDGPWPQEDTYTTIQRQLSSTNPHSGDYYYKADSLRIELWLRDGKDRNDFAYIVNLIGPDTIICKRTQYGLSAPLIAEKIVISKREYGSLGFDTRYSTLEIGFPWCGYPSAMKIPLRKR